MLSIVKLSEVNGEPKAKLDLPESLRVGDPLALRFVLKRQSGGRSEILNVNGRFRVTAIGFDSSRGPHKKLLTVEPVGAPPTWVSVKKSPGPARRLGPARHPRTPI